VLLFPSPVFSVPCFLFFLHSFPLACVCFPITHAVDAQPPHYHTVSLCRCSPTNISIVSIQTQSVTTECRGGGGDSSAEAIYNEAKLSPLNQSPTMVGWESLSKVLDLDFIKGGIGQRVAAKCKL
jgi:hypothetical protein